MASHTPAALFDLDGTLVDSEPAYFRAGRELLAERGVDFGWEDHARFIGVSTRETLAALKRKHGLAEPLDDLLAEKNARYLELVRTEARAYPAMVDLLRLLDAAGVPSVVASGSSTPAIEAVLDATGLAGHFRFTLSADEVAHGKPAPDVFLEAARRLDRAPAACTVLEDSVPGVASARRAGCRCIAVPYDPPADPADLDPEFGTAGLLVPGGQREFDPAAAFAFITADRPV